MSFWWVAGAAGLFVAVELLLRAWKKDERFWESDAELGHRLKSNNIGVWRTSEFSNKVKTNSDGFVDEDFSAKNSQKRVFVFGSSFIEGLQVPREKSATYLLERRLKDTSVFNFAVASYGPVHHLLLLKKYGLKYRPDIVVFTYLIGNDVKNVNPDIEESKNRPFPVLKNGKVEILPPQYDSSPISTAVRLVKKSRLISELFKKHEDNKAPLRWRAYEKNNPAFQRGFEMGEAVILEAKKVAESFGSKFLLVVIPLFIELDNKSWERMKVKYTELKDTKMDFEYPSKRLEKFCLIEGIDCLLLKRAFAEYLKKNGKLPMFSEDTHWNEAGHKLAAEAIADKLNEYFK
jgi:hypothetical protein